MVHIPPLLAPVLDVFRTWWEHADPSSPRRVKTTSPLCDGATKRRLSDGRKPRPRARPSAPRVLYVSPVCAVGVPLTLPAQEKWQRHLEYRAKLAEERANQMAVAPPPREEPTIQDIPRAPKIQVDALMETDSCVFGHQSSCASRVLCNLL